MPTRRRADELQILRLRTLAATRDISFGRVPMTRPERLALHEKICRRLSYRRADRLIAYWSKAPLQLEVTKKKVDQQAVHSLCHVIH